jgi:hypothetical protein
MSQQRPQEQTNSKPGLSIEDTHELGNVGDPAKECRVAEFDTGGEVKGKLDPIHYHQEDKRFVV